MLPTLLLSFPTGKVPPPRVLVGYFANKREGEIIKQEKKMKQNESDTVSKASTTVKLVTNVAISQRKVRG